MQLNFVYIFLLQLAINRTDVSVNRDAPEGGLDALLQATVCKDVCGLCTCSAAALHAAAMHVLQVAHVQTEYS